MSVGDGVPALVLTCEHAGRSVPARWRGRFAGAEAVLSSHRGWDPGALGLARALSLALGAPLRTHEITRLLVDVNRSPRHPALFSEFTRPLGAEERRRILDTCYHPHRESVTELVAATVEERGAVVHVGVHTFTPVLDGRPRRFEVGLLYDPSREPERSLARAWLVEAGRALPMFRARANRPYRGVSDGLVTSLRKCFSADAYSGLELEVGQVLLGADGRFPPHVVRGLAEACRVAFGVRTRAEA